MIVVVLDASAVPRVHRVLKRGLVLFAITMHQPEKVVVLRGRAFIRDTQLAKDARDDGSDVVLVRLDDVGILPQHNFPIALHFSF